MGIIFLQTIRRIPIKHPVQWKVGGFFRGSSGVDTPRIFPSRLLFRRSRYIPHDFSIFSKGVYQSICGAVYLTTKSGWVNWRRTLRDVCVIFGMFRPTPWGKWWKMEKNVGWKSLFFKWGWLKTTNQLCSNSKFAEISLTLSDCPKWIRAPKNREFCWKDRIIVSECLLVRIVSLEAVPSLKKWTDASQPVWKS